MIKQSDDIIDHLIFEWNQERPELDASAMEIVGRVIRLGKLLEKSAGKALQDCQIYYTDLDVLATLRRSGKPYELTPKQLMKSVLITSGSMTALLNRLTKLGLIYRIVDKKDKRIRRAVLTNKGINTIDNAIKLRFEEANNSTSIMNSQEKEQLKMLLKKLLSNLD
ncbi:MarR family winged helix-turn-helix transcriptional regulator [Aquimarina sp. 2201CG5-10]|uniref:MarR family winged helix-turn-helix transcriptional regulator n=1 Tax=Aquimarina callyspongiae TaxID=3098150 RepID=UPI002AB43832|nr:MarR family transcriptional regulator [Aquimarina sp. 2201CG5-10]MDY8137460.1 MarR family transcriptional regulator [Aquimarina sp. 2201CG5-10]